MKPSHQAKAAGERPSVRYGLTMTASPEARFAPIGALRGGLALMVLAALMAWGPVDSIPNWVWLGTLFVGGLLVAIALGIRMLRA